MTTEKELRKLIIGAAHRQREYEKFKQVALLDTAESTLNGFLLDFRNET